MPPVTRSDRTSQVPGSAKVSDIAALSPAQLKTLAAAFVAQAGDGKRFPALDGGNCGVHGYAISGERAQLALDIAGDGAKLDPKHEIVVGLVLTEDETRTSLVIVDTRTNAMREAGDLDFFNRPLTAKNGDEIDGFHATFLMFKGAPELPLPNGDKDWKITSFKDKDGPTSLPAVQLDKPRAPTPDIRVDDAGLKYLAGKMGKHAGTKFPALNAGTRGTHFYEVTGPAARLLADKASGYYNAKEQILVVALETNPERTLHPVLLQRADVGKEGIRADWLDKVSLGALTVELLKDAREIPVAGRVEGFSPSELLPTDAAQRKNAGKVVGSEQSNRPAGGGTAATSPTSTRLAQMQLLPFAHGQGKSVKLGGVAGHELKLHSDASKLAGTLESQRESGDGSFATAYQMDPAALKKALSTDEGKSKLLFDIVVGENGGELSEYDNFRQPDVGRKGAFKAMGQMLYANGGDDESYKGTPERKALDKNIGAMLDRLLGDKGSAGAATSVLYVKSGDAGYGHYEGIIAVNPDAGTVHAFMNSWAP